MDDNVKFSLLVQAIDPPEQFIDFATRAEELGFSSMWVADSSLHARDVHAYLTLAAVHTDDIKIGTGITHPFTRHPAVTANALATLDQISAGRAVMGVGAGDRPVAELGLGPAPVKVVREMIEACRRLFRGERVSLTGEALELVNARLHFPPAAPLPIYVAGSGPRMLALGGEVADGLLVQVGVWPDCLRVALDRIAQGAARAGRDMEGIDVAAMTYGSVRSDRQQAMDEARPFAAWIPQTVPMYCEVAGISEADVAAVQQVYRGGELHEAKEAAQAATTEMVEKFTLSGNAQDVADKVNGILSAGIHHIVYFPMGSDRFGNIERFSRVMADFL